MAPKLLNYLVNGLLQAGLAYLRQKIYVKTIEDLKKDLHTPQLPDLGVDLTDILSVGSSVGIKPSEIEKAIAAIGQESSRPSSKPVEEPRTPTTVSEDTDLERRLREMPQWIMDANEYTKHELLKELRLLEKHLVQATYMPENFCLECAVKHLATIEGLGEEGIQFGSQREKEVYKRIAEWAYKAQKLLLERAKNPVELSEEARRLRKDLEKLMSGVSQLLEGLESRLKKKAET